MKAAGFLKLRQELGMTQEEFRHWIGGYSLSAVHKWERGETSVPLFMNAIARLYYENKK